MKKMLLMLPLLYGFAYADSALEYGELRYPYQIDSVAQYQAPAVPPQYQSQPSQYIPPQAPTSLSQPVTTVQQSAYDRSVNMLLDHGITGLVLFVLGIWYYKRQQAWDTESSSMRKELLEYVKADQTSDYDMMSKWQKNTDEVKVLRNEINELRSEFRDLSMILRNTVRLHEG